MAYKIPVKTEKQRIKDKSEKFKIIYEELNEEADLTFNTEFSKLSEKEQDYIALLVAKKKGIM
jgi:hypothetical protein